ncbi:MAG: nicotinate-nicotinamide nucleotide adenylyltransferase [Phycisphaerales bacterium JB040]
MTRDFSQLPDDGTPFLLFGGSFDPVHRAHTELGFWARDRACPGGWLVFVPAARSPHKDGAPAPGRHRIEMLRLACRGRVRWWVWTEELRRAGASDAPSYWVETLERASSERPGVSLRFLIGSDQALAFHRWHEWGRVLELAAPVVLIRPPLEGVSGLRGAMLDAGCPAPDADRFLGRALVLDNDTAAVAATDAREALRRDAPGSIEGLDPGVERYARTRGLYTDAGA